jgi:hypothetical protein
LIVLGLFVNGWSLDQSSEVFEKLAGLAFKRRLLCRIPIFSRFLEPLIAYLAEGLYASKNIERALKTAFGENKAIFDMSKAWTTGTRIGLPAATLGKAPCRRIFTNYMRGKPEGGTTGIYSSLL